MKQPPKHIITKENEIEFFYNILSQYESESNHKGYNYSRIEKVLQEKIQLELKKTPIVKPKEKNSFYYSGSSKAADFLRHVRNAFAHCNIFSDDTANTFSLYDEFRGECTMSGSMSKPLFYKLIKQLKDTRK